MQHFYSTLLVAPSEPRNLKAHDITKDSLILAWRPPADDGGSPIIGYNIEKKSPYSPRWTKVNREPISNTEAKLTGLNEGEELEFRVSAVNEAGPGKPSDGLGPLKIKDQFGKF